MLIKIYPINTQDQVADIFTKALPKAPFEKLKALLHVQAWGVLRPVAKLVCYPFES